MSFKSFKKFIDEDCGRDAKSLGGDGGAQNQYGRWGQEPVHLGVHRIEDPNVLQRLNAHVGLVNTREYIDPRSALEHIQNALMRLGYQFEYNLDTLPHEQNVYPLRRFGGRQGFIDMDAQVKEDDGIVQTTGQSLVLNVEFFRDDKSSRYEVTAQILPASLFDEEDVQPDPIRPNRAGRSATDGDRDGINIGEQFPAKSKGPTRFKGDPKVKVDKVKGGFQVFVHSPRGFWIAQGQPWPTKAKAEKDAKKFNEGVNEDISRTFAFATPDARDRAEKLFGMSSSGRVTTSDKGRGKFKFTATGNFKGAQLDRIMKSVTQLKGVQAESILRSGERMTEDVSRTFAFPTSDARNRAEKLFTLTGTGKVTTSDKGKGKFKFTATTTFKGAQLDRITKSVTQLKGVLGEDSARDIAHNAVRRAIQERNVGHIFSFRFKTPANANGFIKKIAGLSRVARVDSTSGGAISVAATFDNVGKADKARKIAKDFSGVSESREIQEGKSGTVLFAKKSKKGGDLWDVTIKFGTDFSDTGVGFGTRDAAIRNQGKALQGKFKKAGLKFFSTNMADGHAQVSLDAKNSGDAKKKVSKILGESFTSVAKGHQMKIARDTLKMNDVFSRVMGGMTKKQAAEFLMKNGNSKDKRDAKLELQREAKDENEKELERTRKDGKLAAAFTEAKRGPFDFTLVAIKNNKVVDQFHTLDKKDLKLATEMMKKNNPGAKISVERGGKVVSVEQVTEQISNSSPAWGY